MREALALIRVAWLSAASYRLALLISLAGLLVTVVPIYFISGALQPIVAGSIAAEGGDYFGFLITGIAATYLIAAATAAVPGAIAGNLGSGTFEALLSTRAPLPALLLGLAGYPLLWNLLRALLLVGGATVVGVEFSWGAIVPVTGIAVLLLLAYAGIGLVAAALILVFRTAGPLVTAVIAGSGLLGGVYYSAAAIPSWLQSLSAIVPLTYGLRAARMLLLGGAGVSDVSADVATLVLLTGTALALGGGCFLLALRHARTAGTLSQY